MAYLTRARSGTRWRALGRRPCPGRAVWSWHSVWMTSVVLRPLLRVSRWRRVTLKVRHVVGRVGRIGRVGGTRRGYVWIYRYIGIRLDILGMMMVILVSILQGH